MARVVIPDVPHHVTQRGNNRQDVFFTEDDRRAYLDFLHAEAVRFRLDVLGYCLMTNHVHLIVIPRTESSLAHAIGRAHWKYTQWINRFHDRSGHLWQGRYYSAAMDDEHFLAALAYIERNPIRAGVALRAWDYAWSTAAAHIGKRTDRLVDARRWETICGRLDWQAILARPEDDQRTRALRRNTRTGRPLGSDSFISKLETRLGRRLRPLPIGRPRPRRRSS